MKNAKEVEGIGKVVGVGMVEHEGRSEYVVWVQVKVYLLLLYVLATLRIISGRVPTCDSTHSWQLHSAVPLGNKAINTTT